jgi:hypothetical protein
MEENVASKRMMNDIESLIQNYIDSMKKNNQKPTRDDILEIIASRLDKLLEVGVENKEIMWIMSGVAIGIAVVLQAEDMLDAE